MSTSFYLMNVQTTAISSSIPIVRDRSPPVVLQLRLQDWCMLQYLSTTQEGLQIGSAGNRPLEWRFHSPDLYVFLQPRVSRSLVVRMLSRLPPLGVDSETREGWVALITSALEAAARRALILGWGAMVGVVEIDRFMADDVEEDVIQRVLRLSEETSYGDENFGAVPASESSIEKLETTRYEGEGGNSGAGEVEGGTCVICYQDFSPREEVTEMPCKHVFHGCCITQWLKRSHTCPICRFQMPKKMME